ncbi:MAG: HAD-IA family hydrolase [Bacteriovoracia bacterium]
MLKNLIFDFDRTLVDTLDLALQFGNSNQHRFSKKTISKEEFRRLSMREALRKIGLPWYKLPRFLYELKGELKNNIDKVQIFDGIFESVEFLYSKNTHLYILSSNSASNVKLVLDKFKLGHCFKNIIGDSSLFGKHVVLKNFLKKENLNKNDCIYIGDEVRDIDACRKIGLPIVAVGWGWDDKERLQKTGQAQIFSHPEELKNLI